MGLDVEKTGDGVMVAKLTTEQQAERKNYREFILAFAEAAGMEPQTAVHHWSEYTRIMTTYERRVLESGGTEAGLRYGKTYSELFDGVKMPGLLG